MVVGWITSQHVFLRGRPLLVSQHPTPRHRRADSPQGKCEVGLEGESGRGRGGRMRGREGAREGGREGEGQTAFQADSSSLISEVEVVDGGLELSSSVPAFLYAQLALAISTVAHIRFFIFFSPFPSA